MNDNKLKKILYKLSYTKIVAGGYFLLLMIGTFLLMLPVSANSGEWTSFPDALTTATSASCVTGLIVFDTFTQWSGFGQAVLLFLIQVGGLGYMTIIMFISVLIGRKIGIRERGLLKESTNALQMGGLVALAKKAILGTLIFESAGAILLFLRFLKYFPVGKALWFGIFHSVSAFCNAGFDLMGAIEPYSSVTHFASDPFVLIVLSVLIFTGGIGFIVWNDFCVHKFRLRKYKLHSKIALFTSICLVFSGALLIFIAEYSTTLGEMNIFDKITNSLFASVSARTAGMNSFDLASSSPVTYLVNIIFMLIGGSPGSTAGGMKTTTIAVLVLAGWANMRNSKHVNIFGRRLEDDVIKKALTVTMIYFSLTVFSSVLISLTNPSFSLSEVLFEVSSAIGTVGLSVGVTGECNLFGQILLTLLMYCGRVGSMSFAMIFTEVKSPSHIQMPSEKIIIG